MDFIGVLPSYSVRFEDVEKICPLETLNRWWVNFLQKIFMEPLVKWNRTRCGPRDMCQVKTGSSDMS